MLEKEKPDLVSVCVPNCFHKEYTITALNAKANVLCEKPLAFRLSDAKEMFDTAKRNGKILMACQSMRFTPDRLAAKEYIDENGLGNIYYGDFFARKAQRYSVLGNVSYEKDKLRRRFC
ncbi:MAG: Gfo/Idh/MocA family oxidoreductase [Clostridiales bacterium]|nr:MAG: Gfo/Idh/MocA family oxidoreductase [Clostridiales bacterium]